MPGGLLQIASSGIQDKYLTKNPEITFFKKTYRRYTNFSRELIEVNIENFPDYGDEFFINIPKYGDLVHRSFLKVDIPKLNLDDSYITNEIYKKIKSNRLSNILAQENLWKHEYDKMVLFSNIQIAYYTKLKILLQSQDVSFDTIQKKSFNERNINSNALDDIVFSIDEDIKDKIDIISYVNNLNKKFGEQDNTAENTITYVTFNNNINTLYNNNLKQLKYYHSNYIYQKKEYQKVTKGTLNYSWVKNLGHHYFSSNEFELNGEQMERYSNDYLNIYQSHHLKDEYIKNYNELIGNTESVNKFDSEKENNSLLIPNIFWFNRNSSFSLPLVSMKHSNAQYNFRINNLENLICFEDFEFEFNEVCKFSLPFKDHSINGETVKAIFKSNSNVSESDIEKISYLKNERIYIYYFKYITPELLSLKFKNLTTSQINSLFTSFSSNGTTLTLEDWIKFRLNPSDYSSELNILSREVNYYNHYEFIDTNILRNKIGVPKVKIFLEYIYLDELERFKFAKNNLEYIVSFPHETITSLNNETFFSFNLNLNRPTKEIFWFLRPNLLKNGFNKYSNKNPNLYNQYYFDNNILEESSIYLQDDVLVDFKFGENQYLYTTKYNKLNRIGALEDSNFYYFTFSLYPESDQPSGTANFSIINSKNILFELNNLFLKSYYNQKININQQEVEFVLINTSYSLLTFSKGRAKKIIY